MICVIAANMAESRPMRFSFCPKCGGQLATQIIDHHERPVCTHCAFVVYQNSKPCVGALILEGRKLLLVKRAEEPFKDYWDIPGGFLEAGEHPESGALREILEETSLHIQLGELLGIFTDVYATSGDPTLNLFYTATITGGEARAGSDATGLQWFDLHDLPEQIAFKSAHEVLALLENVNERKKATDALAESKARLLAEMLSVLAINRALVSEIELDNLLEFIMAQAQHLMNAEGAAVLLLNDDQQQLEVATPGKSWLHVKPGSRLPVQDSLAGLAMANQQAQISNYALADDRTASVRALLEPYYRVRSLLCAPLMAQSRNLGILLVWSEREQNFTEQDGRLMSLFADQAALALRNAHLHRRNRQLAIEQERQRMARDLHDSVTQSLYSIRLAAQASLRLLDEDIDGRVREAIEHIQVLSQTALIEMRIRIYDLNPTNQTAEGLVRALTRYCDVLRDQYSLTIDFMAGPEPPLSIYQREILYGIAKEALWNVIKHAEATYVNVGLKRENDQLVLSVTDDGIGFDPLFIRVEAMGLRSMEERAKLLGGNFELQSKPEQGTRLMVWITIPPT